MLQNLLLDRVPNLSNPRQGDDSSEASFSPPRAAVLTTDCNWIDVEGGRRGRDSSRKLSRSLRSSRRLWGFSHTSFKRVGPSAGGEVRELTCSSIEFGST